MVLARWNRLIGVAIRHIGNHRYAAHAAAVSFCAVALFLLHALATSKGGVLETSRNWVFDFYQRTSPVHTHPETILIDIDDESLNRIGQWPWPRDQLAHLIDAVVGARVIGLDLLLTEPDRLSPGALADDHPALPPDIKEALLALPSTDDALAASLGHANIVLAAAANQSARFSNPTARPITPILEDGSDMQSDIARYGSLAWPLPSLSKAASGIGLVSLIPESDGIVRRMPVIAAQDGMLIPSFAAEILRVALASDHIDWRSNPLGDHDVVIGDIHIPTDRSGRVWIRYDADARPATIPAYKVLSGTISPSDFRDRIVLIGTSAAGVADVVMTPLHRPESGMSVEANLIDSMLTGAVLRRPPAMLGAELLIALSLGIAATRLVDRLTIRTYIFLFMSLALAVIAGSFLTFAIIGVLADWTLPIMVLTICTLTAFAIRLRKETIQRRLHAKNLATALLQARAADQAKSEFLANASHELRTPLTAIIGFSEVMTMELLGPLEKIYSEYARDIHLSANHLLTVINGILDLSVIDLGGRKPADDTIDVGQLVAACRRMVLPHANQLRIEVVTAMAGPLPLLTADEGMVRQMLLNLLSNAIKHSPPGGMVTIKISADAAGWLCLAVRDQGAGIAADDLPRILQRFARLRSASLAQQPGIGIGLALTKSMIDLHDGRLEINSKLQAGTEVILRFRPSRLSQIMEPIKCEDAE